MGSTIESGFETSSEVPMQEPESRISFLAGMFQWFAIISLAIMGLLGSHKWVALIVAIAFATVSIALTVVGIIQKRR